MHKKTGSCFAYPVIQALALPRKKDKQLSYPRMYEYATVNNEQAH